MKFRLQWALCLAAASTFSVSVAQAVVPKPVAVVDAFHAALHDGHPQSALKLLTQNVYIAEQGFVDTNRAQYAKSQVNEDAAFARATHYKVLNRHLIWLGDSTVCVISQTRTTGTFSGHAIDLIGAETALLQKIGPNWRITHLHWSAHPAPQPPAAGDGAH